MHQLHSESQVKVAAQWQAALLECMNFEVKDLLQHMLTAYAKAGQCALPNELQICGQTLTATLRIS